MQKDVTSEEDTKNVCNKSFFFTFIAHFVTSVDDQEPQIK